MKPKELSYKSVIFCISEVHKYFKLNRCCLKISPDL